MIPEPFTDDDAVSRGTALAEPASFAADEYAAADHDPDTPGAQIALDWYSVPIDGKYQAVGAPDPESAATIARALWEKRQRRAPMRVGQARLMTPRQVAFVLAAVATRESDHHRLGTERPSTYALAMRAAAMRRLHDENTVAALRPFEPERRRWRYFNTTNAAHTLRSIGTLLVLGPIVTLPMLLKLLVVDWDAPFTALLLALAGRPGGDVRGAVVVVVVLGVSWLWFLLSMLILEPVFEAATTTRVEDLGQPRSRDYRSTRRGRT